MNKSFYSIRSFEGQRWELIPCGGLRFTEAWLNKPSHIKIWIAFLKWHFEIVLYFGGAL